MSSASSAHTVVTEAQFHNFETKLQYEKSNPLPFLIEREMLGETVGDVKRYLLNLNLLSHVMEKPEKLGMYIVLDPDHRGEESKLLLMDEDKQMRDYLEDLSRSRMLKLLTLMGVNQH